MATPEQARVYYLNNKEKIKATREKYKQEYPEKVKESQRNYKAKDPLKHRTAKYGISTDEYNQLLESQDNACAVCAEPFTNTPHIDHCHNTQQVRGLLCNLCNIGLGAFYDDPERMESAVQYLRRFIDGENQQG